MTVRLQDAPFDAGALLAAFSAGRKTVGAVVSFTGLARAVQGRDAALTLEAYPGFTESEIVKIIAQATTRFALEDALVVHRTGTIPVGEAIVFVATAAAHRREAFEAVDFLMDYLKSRAPFWKKEEDAGGETRWIEPTARDQDDAARWD